MGLRAWERLRNYRAKIEADTVVIDQRAQGVRWISTLLPAHSARLKYVREANDPAKVHCLTASHNLARQLLRR